jgi:hypothetical protein
MTNKKKPDLYDLMNDDSLWGNQETDALTHDDIMDKKWIKAWDSARKERHSKVVQKFAKTDEAKKLYKQTAELNRKRVPDVIAISPEGKKHVFVSLTECEKFLNCGPLFKHLPEDGMPYRGERRAKKNWIFYRDIPNKNRKAELKQLSKIVDAKVNPVLTHPWRSATWRASPEGQKYLAELQKRRDQPNKKDKKVMTPDGIFNTNKAAAEHYGITPASFHSKKMHNKDTYYNCDEHGNRIK